MAFKRDGDDTALLNNLRKRRVAELLSFHIPEDEAILLKNGRYSCSVCSYRPIFDTLSVLAIHRKGKKHLSSLTNRLKLQNDIQPAPDTETQPINSMYQNCTKAVQRAKSTPYSRKKTIIVKEKLVKKPETKTASMSCKSIIKNYLTSASKKRDFASFVDKSRHKIMMTSHTHSSTTIPSINVVQQVSEKNRGIICPLNLERRKEVEHSLSLREKGWIKSEDGTWVKEDGVEFDSDEEILV